MAGYINKYVDNAAYSDSAEASARAALGSTVSMETDTKVIHYDGVNVELSRKAVKVGTLVYADSNGTVHFIDGASAKAASINSGWELVGVVALRRGNKATVLYKSENTSVRFASCWAWEIQGVTMGVSNTIQFQQRALTAEGASTYTNVDVGSEFTFTPADIDDAVSKIDTFLRANQGGKTQSSLIVANYNWHCAKLQNKIWVIADYDNTASYRQYEVQVVKNTTISNGPISANNMWSLGGFDTNNTSITRRDGVNSNYFSIWNKEVVRVKGMNQGSPADEVGHDGYYSETAFNNSTVLKAYYGTYDNYCQALMPKYPCATRAMGAYAGRGKADCDRLDSVTYVPKDGSAAVNMFSAVHWSKSQKAHSTASVAGMNVGDWYMPGLDEIVDIFAQMKVDGSDAIHKALANAGITSAYPINPSSNAYRWVPALYDGNGSWLLHTSGYIYAYSLLDNLRAVAVALLEL